MNKGFAKRVLRLVDGYGVLDGAFCLRPAKHVISGIAIDNKGASERIYRYALPLYDLILFLHLDYATLLPWPGNHGAERRSGISVQELAELILAEDGLTRNREEPSGFRVYLEELMQSMRSRGVAEPALVAYRFCLAATFARTNDYPSAITEIDSMLDLVEDGQPGLRRFVEAGATVPDDQAPYTQADIRQVGEAISFRRKLKGGLSAANRFLDQREEKNRSIIDALWLEA